MAVTAISHLPITHVVVLVQGNMAPREPGSAPALRESRAAATRLRQCKYAPRGGGRDGAQHPPSPTRVAPAWRGMTN